MMNMNLEKVLKMVNSNPKQKRVWLNVGVPASGKSTFIKMLQDKIGGVIVSRDDIRFSMVTDEHKYFSKEKEVFKMYVDLANSAIGTDIENIYLDATHINASSRRKILDKLNLDGYEVVALFFDSILDTCLDRNLHRTGMKHVPEYAISRMFEDITVPDTSKEKIDKVIMIDEEDEI